MNPFQIDFQDLSGTFSAFDVAASLGLSLLLSLMVATVYRATHRNISYSQSYVQTLVILGMLIALIMLVVGSNIARAFALVGGSSTTSTRTALPSVRRIRPAPRSIASVMAPVDTRNLCGSCARPGGGR